MNRLGGNRNIGEVSVLGDAVIGRCRRSRLPDACSQIGLVSRSLGTSRQWFGLRSGLAVS
jgi:hypothetical protein